MKLTIYFFGVILDYRIQSKIKSGYGAINLNHLKET